MASAVGGRFCGREAKPASVNDGIRVLVAGHEDASKWVEWTCFRQFLLISSWRGPSTLLLGERTLQTGRRVFYCRSKRMLDSSL